MIDFKIKRGLSADLHNPRLIIEEGSWYLCTDTAELFLGVLENGVLKLKQINGPHEGPIAAIEELRATLKSVQESLSTYATEQFVTDAIAEVIPVESLAKKEEVEEVKTKLESEVLPIIPTIQETIIPTVQELSEKAATQEWVQQGYAKKSDIPTDYIKEIPSYYVTETDLKEELANIKVPEVDTSKFVSKEVFKGALAEKADTILFKNSRTVTNPVGGFATGDDVKGLSIAQLFAKLLELTDEAPTEPEGIVETVIAYEIPLHQASTDSGLAEVPYSFTILTESQAAEMPKGPGFYQIVDENDIVIESGYHQLSVDNPDMPYVIALSNLIDFNKNITIKKFDDGFTQEWVNYTMNLTNDTDMIQSVFNDIGIEVPTVPEGFTLWADLEHGNDKSIYRFIIIE